MKKLIFIFGMTAGIYAGKINAQSDTANYVLMKVNDAILDCPHFQGLFRQMYVRNNWKEVERNYQKRYLICAYPKNAEYDVISKFKEELKGMNFPMGVITDIYTKNNLEELKKSLGN
ncbi:MAG: hypothetical protein KatS3mg028_1333 [Bacteroidia bacterium]|nr:MAG: hypothetical protein KatS3mg028_1333 [Bacteroidia bacterium]